MEAAAAKRKYGQGAVYGSLAYDFNNPELYPDGFTTENAPARPRTRTQTQTRTRVRTRAHAAPRTRQGIAPLSIVGVLIAAFLFVTAVLAQAQLVGLSSTSVSLQQQLGELEEQQAKLRIAYESAFNMADIEEYAIKSLGMQRPRADQVCYIDTSASDKAVVVATGSSDGLVDRISDFLSGVGEYFY